MSVASTKAFYAQIAAGFLLALALAGETGALEPSCGRTSCSRRCASSPTRWSRCSTGATTIAAVAQRHAPAGGTGRSSATAPTASPRSEVRIKLSELCYKSIACDVTEDKKHIDLSSEPLILVCAAGLAGSNADDVAKEVAIYRAHKAAPIVIATEGDEPVRRRARDDRASPPCTPRSAFVLSAMAGHLFGYEAALAIDASARPLREARAAIEAVGRDAAATPTTCSSGSRRSSSPAGRGSSTGSAPGTYDGHLEASTAVRVASLLRYATGIAAARRLPGRATGKVGTPSTVVEDLTAALTDGDRGAHPAGRRDQAPGQDGDGRDLPLRRDAARRCRSCSEVLAAGVGRDSLSYRGAAHARRARPRGRRGHRLHAVPHRGRPRPSDADDPRRRPRRHRGELASRTDARPAPARHEAPRRARARGHGGRGRRDGRTLIIVPEVKGNADDRAHAAARRVPRPPRGRRRARGVLQGYRDRYAALQGRRHRDRADVRRRRARRRRRSSTCSPSPVYVLADRWRTERGAAHTSPVTRTAASSGSARTWSRSTGSAWRCERRARLARAALQRRRARLRVPSPRPGAAARGAVRGQGSGDEGAGRRARRSSSSATSRCARAERRARRRAVRQGGRARRRARGHRLAPLAHPHRLMAMAVAIALAAERTPRCRRSSPRPRWPTPTGARSRRARPSRC